MKINFGNYTYYDGKIDNINTTKGTTEYPSTIIQSYMLSKNKFNQLISTHQYTDATD